MSQRAVGCVTRQAASFAPPTDAGACEPWMSDLPNYELRPEHIPRADAEWYPTIVDFALTFDGYEAMGVINRLSEYAKRWYQSWKDDGSLPRDLIHLRSCLFMVYRAVRRAE